ncbi:hypothetical protein F7U66_01515 [Vibrio parahaemolyticus]|nr:hypothetical protein [Vibrio parahaemolyticus]
MEEIKECSPTKACSKCCVRRWKNKLLFLFVFALVFLGNVAILYAYYQSLILPEAVVQSGGVM